MVAMGMDKLQDLRSQISKNGKRKREKNMVSADKLQELLDKSNKLLMKSREDVWKLPEWRLYVDVSSGLINACHEAESVDDAFLNGAFAHEIMDEVNTRVEDIAIKRAYAWTWLKKTKEWKVMVKAMKESAKLLDERKRRMEKEGEEQRVID